MQARQGSSHPIIGPGPALGISAWVTRRMIKGWTSTKHEYGQSHVKGILQRLSPERAGEILNLSRNQPGKMMGLPTEHCNLNEHLYVVGNPGRYRCKEALETASHILYDCEALVVLRFRHLDHNFLEPGDCTDISFSKVQHYIQSAELLKCPP